MSTQKIVFDGPILPGTVSTAIAKCGKEYCRCQEDPKAMHGPYYRWHGKIDGKLTTKTISKEAAAECERRIKNYRGLKKQVDKLLKDGILEAPWTTHKPDK